MLKLFSASLMALMICAGMTYSQSLSTTEDTSTNKTILQATNISGLKFRELGPALTSGRISDFAFHPDNPKIYYVATASGGVWKTVNAGTTYEPLFDKEGSYSIGCVTLDPHNPSTVWVGSGENNNQRSVAYGDGIYRSDDGGKNWENMGLEESEHIGSIIVHPDSSNVVYVAAIGPLWNAGGDRGVYKTSDGGKSWKAIFEIDEHTGVNELVMDPRDPNVMYATAFQRRRHVFTYLGGGPGSGIYKTSDGGATWSKLTEGLPKVDIGRIGLSISPANPEIIYAIVEAARDKGGFYRSTDRGATWERRGNYSSSGNYYQEIIADPVDPDKIYAMNTWMQVSTDGGKTFNNVGEDTKHVDNHCIWIDPSDTEHFIVGCDGGIYETWDAAKTWDFKANLPVVQFYKVAVDNSEPFYYIYGGTQDNFSLGGPSRSVSGNGISNEQWFITHGGDGFESQVDHFNTNIVYAQSQYGVLSRYDKQSGEEVGIQPKPRKDENSYRWNWDAPLIASPHAEGRVYFAANKVFRSDDYGSNWEVISDDLTRQINRNELEVMGRIWEVDAVMKNQSTSQYGTIVAMAESTLNPDLLYVGTDDGLIHKTVDGGDSWTAIDNIAGVPERTYVNAVVTSMHDESIVYACFNHHKYGDFKPYVFRSSDGGSSWANISSNLPERGSAYSIMEDHVNPDLLFVGTEFGVFFSSNGGNEWRQLRSGVPTIAVRDIDIQRSEDDLVLGTFGRGFFVLDDYSALREISDESLEQVAALYDVRDALVYEQSMPLGLPGKSFQGDSYWQGQNLGPVALITYYLKDEVKSLTEQREDAQKEARKEDRTISYPTYEQLVAESTEDDPMLWFTIRDANGNIVHKLEEEPKKGLRRTEWNLRYPPKDPISLRSREFYNPFAGVEEGPLVAPGTYTVEMGLWQSGELTSLAEPVQFEVRALDNTTIPADNRDEMVAFRNEVAELSGAVEGTQRAIGEVEDELRHIRVAISRMSVPSQDIMDDVIETEDELTEIKRLLNGDRIAGRLDIDTPPSVSQRIGMTAYEQKYSTSRPTGTHQRSLEIALEEFKPLHERVKTVIEVNMNSLRDQLRSAGAPYTPGALPELTDF